MAVPGPRTDRAGDRSQQDVVDLRVERRGDVVQECVGGLDVEDGLVDGGALGGVGSVEGEWSYGLALLSPVIQLVGPGSLLQPGGPVLPRGRLGRQRFVADEGVEVVE